jgi:CBS domain-containing protein
MKVKEIMVTDSLQYCSPETKLHNAAKAMKDANCGALPVVDKNKKVVGMITDRDICLSLANKQEKPVSRLNVGDIITANVHTVKANHDINTALREMRDNRVGRLPVVDNEGRLKGILTIHNLLSKNFIGNRENGQSTAAVENISRTIHALADSYCFNVRPKTRTVSAGRSLNWEESW